MKSFNRKYFGDKIHIIILILNILFGILFIFSAGTKFFDITGFESSIKKFALVPDYFAGAISYFIPSIELILGSFLIFKIKLELTLQLLIYLLVFFTSIISVTLVEGGDISCGCFGSLSSSNIDLTTFFRNIFLLVWGLLLLIYTLKNKYSASANHKIKNKIKIFFYNKSSIFSHCSEFGIRNSKY